ncbi:MAG TPA: hypothetical protein VL688_03605 [Verrucomicrobiae bacterium]|nr:hypothetical protein [Verrucomicrobiae bacterium]
MKTKVLLGLAALMFVFQAAGFSADMPVVPGKDAVTQACVKKCDKQLDETSKAACVKACTTPKSM